MLAIFIALIVNTAIVFFVSYIMPGVKLSSLWVAVIVALVLALINAFTHYLLQWMTLPANYFTYGIASLILSICALIGITYILPGFEIDSFYWVLFFAAIVGISNGLIHSLLHY